MELSLEALNARIARLAMALGVSLNRDDEVARVMSWQPPAPVEHERRRTLDGGEVARAAASGDRRVAHQREELRGLLVLRYQVEKRYVDDTGVSVTREVLVAVEENLVRKGFQPGADGIDLNRLFGRS